jgi:hypothetical protein
MQEQLALALGFFGQGCPGWAYFQVRFEAIPA